MTPLPPGRTIGIIGCGQLGRMLVLAAAQLGYPCHVYGREPLGPAGQVAAHFTEGDYDDAGAIAAFAAACDVVTYEWENLPADPLAALDPDVDLFPGVRPLEVGQSRLAEKTFVAALGGLTAPFAPVRGEGELADAIDSSGVPAIIKSDRMGYDGKGQVRLHSRDDLDGIWQALGGQQALAEGFVDFEAEFSILLVRGRDGAIRFWDAPHNVHEDGILRCSNVPAPESIATHIPAARALARKVATELDYVGVLAIEFFATKEGPVFNEMAPRVHNSGHWTIEGAATSQFENHIRAICGLPLGDTRLIEGGAQMHNLIGEEVGQWRDHLSDSGSHLHLYGKREPRPGRKMGHVTQLLPYAK
ncbi:MAG: 5-(carboxyamino)imidazole ribonucleotide synthase [Pseudomonadota bacterium]